jgi:hypothetical protein
MVAESHAQAVQRLLESRLAQGLPAHVEDPSALAKVAAAIIADGTEPPPKKKKSRAFDRLSRASQPRLVRPEVALRSDE